jgi:hydroxymethylpyrimidine kinase/phosphomethylpyrimidine kinase
MNNFSVVGFVSFFSYYSMMDSSSKKEYTRVLTIAGSDSGGGAGIQADLKTFSSLGCYGMSAISALTAQNTVGVSGIHDIPTNFIVDQMNAVFDDIGVDAVKTGMLHRPEVIQKVAQVLKSRGVSSLVVDPVMFAKSGDKLLLDEAISALKEELIPLATVLTPNIPEAEILLDRRLDSSKHLAQAAKDLCNLGPQAVVVKGGHLKDNVSDDWLFIKKTERIGVAVQLHCKRIETNNLHGAGCSFSAAIASFLALGNTIEHAIKLSREFITGAITAGSDFKLGNGNGPIMHFYKFWKS